MCGFPLPCRKYGVPCTVHVPLSISTAALQAIDVGIYHTAVRPRLFLVFSKASLELVVKSKAFVKRVTCASVGRSVHDKLCAVRYQLPAHPSVIPLR